MINRAHVLPTVAILRRTVAPMVSQSWSSTVAALPTQWNSFLKILKLSNSYDFLNCISICTATGISSASRSWYRQYVSGTKIYIAPELISTEEIFKVCKHTAHAHEWEFILSLYNLKLETCNLKLESNCIVVSIHVEVMNFAFSAHCYVFSDIFKRVHFS